MAPATLLYRRVLIVVLVLVGLALLAVPGAAARPNTPSNIVPQTQNPVDPPPITLEPGQSITLTLEAFCVDYGLPFPRQFPPITDMSTPETVQILRYAISKGYTTSQPYQVQLALWRQTSGEWKSTDNALAQQIYNAGTQASNNQAAPASGQTLLQAAGANSVQVKATSWTPLPAAPEKNPWSGQGTLQITNPGSNTATITVPLGIVVSGGGTDQDVIMYATGGNAQGGAQAAAQTTPAATTTSGGGAAAQATTTTTTAASTPAATTTTGGTVAAQATPAATATLATTTTAASTPATTGGTGGAQAPTPRPTTASSTLPHTGGEPLGDSSFLIILGALLLISGLALAVYRPAASR